MVNTNKSTKSKARSSKNSNSKNTKNLDAQQSKSPQPDAQQNSTNLSAVQNADAPTTKLDLQKTESKNLQNNANSNQTQQSNANSSQPQQGTVNNSQSKQPAKLTKKQEVGNIIKFVLFSISAGVIQILSFTLLNEVIIKDVGNQYGWSYFISLTLSVLWNFTINRKFTFKSASNIPLAMLLVFAYYCVFTPLSIWWGDALTQAHWNEYLVLFLTMIINMTTEFLWSRFVVYKNSINTAKK